MNNIYALCNGEDKLYYEYVINVSENRRDNQVDNAENLATVSRQDTGRCQAKQKHNITN